MKPRRFCFYIVMMALLGGLLWTNVQPVAAGPSVLESACTLVSIKEKILTVVSRADGKERAYKIDKDTLFLDSEGKTASMASFEPGDPITVGTEIGAGEALSVRKGLAPDRH